jgi:hypothetical protein
MNVSDFKTVISLLDVGMGTNHFGNLLSTSDLIAPRVAVIDYHDYLINEYTKKTYNVHIASMVDFTTLDKDDNQHIINTATKPYVLAGHLTGFWGAKDIITSFGNFLVFLGQATQLNYQLAKRTPYIEKFLTMYNPAFLVNNLGISKNNIITFDPNLLFSSNITQLIEVLNNKSNLNLDKTFCQVLHDIWWNKIILKSLV